MVSGHFENSKIFLRMRSSFRNFAAVFSIYNLEVVLALMVPGQLENFLDF